MYNLFHGTVFVHILIVVKAEQVNTMFQYDIRNERNFINKKTSIE